MKIRNGFVSNSSSTSFIITNKTDKKLTLVDFVKENIELVDDFKEQYSWHKDDKQYTHELMLKCAKDRGEYFAPGETEAAFGDEDGDAVGHVFDYMLREGGESTSFMWRFNEWRR